MKIKLGVIGFGGMGKWHALKCAESRRRDRCSV